MRRAKSTKEQDEFYAGFTSISPPPPKKGVRVLICGDHPWSGHSGEYVDDRSTPFGIRPVIRLDNGHECFLMDSSKHSVKFLSSKT